MKNLNYLLIGFIFLYAGCTNNNQDEPANFAYLNVNETYNIQNSNGKTYDINNDGIVDWGFSFSDANSAQTLGLFVGFYNYSVAYENVYDPINNKCIGRKILPYGYTIQSTNLLGSTCDNGDIFRTDPNPSYPNDTVNTYIPGSGDFYIGFKSWNPQFTNVNFGWARLNVSADGKTLIVKDMALNKVNGGSINVGQQ